MNRLHYTVDGIVNESMKTQLKHSLEKVEGVNKVCVDLGRGSVEVIYNEPANENNIKSCIENTGYRIH